MNSEEKNKKTIIPPISNKEAEKLMRNANQDIKDAERVINGEHVTAVRPISDKGFWKFCGDYKELKKVFNNNNDDEES